MTRILVVEDEPGIALGLRNDLTLEGYSVEVAEDGRTATEKATATPFDLILLDVMLPGKDGFAVARDLRRAGLKTPIILLTARAQESDKVLGLELGADDYVTKPFSPMELCARIKAVLRRSAAQFSDRIRFGNIDVDFGSAVVRRNTVPVELTALEFKVLTALIHAKGRFLSRDQLIDQVWGPGVSITDRVVDNHIMNLRRKLEDNSAQPRFLLNVRGLGYRFQNPEEIQTEI
jgi:DNA-binding response OmpR family regulator